LPAGAPTAAEPTVARPRTYSAAMHVTFASADGVSEQLDLGEGSDLTEVRSILEAMLNIPADRQVLVLNGRHLPSGGTLGEANVTDGSFVLVADRARGSPAPAAQRAPRAPAATGQIGQTGQPGQTGASSAGWPAGSITGLSQAGASGAGPVFWDGMSVDQVMENNTNPEHIVDILQRNPRILLELNFHHPDLAEHMRKDRATAISELRLHMMMNATAITMDRLTSRQQDQDMERRLSTNPMDEEANKYFGDKIRKEQVQESYINMMTNYPESLTRVLMLYIEVEINGVSLQAFVDSGAQSSVISGRCAEKCNIARLIDDRFAGQVVGVGTGRTLGRVHVADIKIEGNHFPISLTVMDDSQGLGDKNMEFLLGLDMLKRHRCTIDLASGKLLFHGASGEVSTPFLHEKDLPESKGGTKGFNPNMQPRDGDDGECGSSSSGNSSSSTGDSAKTPSGTT